MKSILQSFTAVIFILFLAGCAAKVVNTVAHMEPVPSKAEVMNSFTEEQLAQGKTLFENNCAECHKLKDPQSRNPEEWNKVLKRMFPRTHMTYDESKLVRAYLVANSQ